MVRALIGFAAKLQPKLYTFEYFDAASDTWCMSLVRTPEPAKAAEFAGRWLAQMAVTHGEFGVSVRVVPCDHYATAGEVSQRMREADVSIGGTTERNDT